MHITLVIYRHSTYRFDHVPDAGRGGTTSAARTFAYREILLCALLGIDLGRYRDRIDMLAGSVNIVKFDLHGPLLQVLGNRAYMGEELAARPGT